MTDVYNDYRRKSGAREDPRLARRDKSSSNERPKQQYDKLGVPISPKRATPTPSPTTTTASDPLNNWQHHQQTPQSNQYSTNMQTAYQHLPPSMYADHNQYSTQGYSTAYTTYPHNYVTQGGIYNVYEGYTAAHASYNNPVVQPGPPGEEYPRNEWAPVAAGYPNMSQPPPAAVRAITEQKNDDQKKDAVAQELKQQKAHMAKQREEYVRKVGVLRRELELLRNQKQELLAEHSSEHENDHILRENNKLQVEIQNKMKTIYNVVEMLTNIIGDQQSLADLEEISNREQSPKQRGKEKGHKSASTDNADPDNTKRYYIYYDPELHWCRICDVFPKSAKDYLLHLHSKEHRRVTQERDMVDTPWHRLPAETELPSFEGAAKKRMPIKGLQFLISATAWYCKLCDSWVGDLHCASQHLKSQNHNQNYANFVEQNPHWEIEWLRDRDKALLRTSSKDKESDDSEDDEDDSDAGKNKKHKDKHSASESVKKDKKKKKKKRRKRSSDTSSSSSSSDSSSEDDGKDNSKSIRVAMRNKMKLQAQMIMKEDLGGKWEVLGRLVEEHKRKGAADMAKESGSEDNLINQWMTVNEPPDKDKRLFDNLKGRMKQKQDAEKAKQAELDRMKRENENQERELREKKEKEEKEAKEREEEKQRLQEEMERQKEKEREQIRFKTREKYNNNKKGMDSPERSRRYSRSPSNENNRKRERSPERYRRDSHYNSENGRRNRRSPSYERNSKSYRQSEKEAEAAKRDKRLAQLSAHKKPHFIGRMPLFKNKKNEEKVEKEIKKEDYDIPRQSRFQPGHLARSFIPEPEVVCFPRLSSIPPLMMPPPPLVQPPEPPIISETKLKAPPPPIINDSKEKKVKIVEEDIPAPPPPPSTKESKKEPPKQLPTDFQDALNLIYPDPSQMGMDPAAMMQYQYSMDYNSMMYSQMYDYSQDIPAEPEPPEDPIPLEHTMPLPPPPLPPDDPNEDLAMLGISADDMAAQMF